MKISVKIKNFEYNYLVECFDTFHFINGFDRKYKFGFLCRMKIINFSMNLLILIYFFVCVVYPSVSIKKCTKLGLHFVLMAEFETKISDKTRHNKSNKKSKN